MLSATAFACPQGTALTGGTGANHKGGKCTAVEKTAKQHVQMAKHEAKKTEQHAQAPLKAAHPAENHQAMAVQKDIKKAEHEKAKADMHPAQHDAKPAKS